MPSLSREEGLELLEIAHEALRLRILQKEDYRGQPKNATLLEPGSLFVTLKKSGTLRGCIGCTNCSEPLYLAAARCAVAAALSDPRFEPLQPEELGDVNLSVSVLGEFQPITRADEVQVGRHGLMIRKGNRQGLLLPQVAVEWNLDAARFLELVCRKAGLPADAWLSGAELYVFPAEIFNLDSE